MGSSAPEETRKSKVNVGAEDGGKIQVREEPLCKLCDGLVAMGDKEDGVEEALEEDEVQPMRKATIPVMSSASEVEDHRKSHLP